MMLQTGRGGRTIGEQMTPLPPPHAPFRNRQSSCGVGQRPCSGLLSSPWQSDHLAWQMQCRRKRTTWSAAQVASIWSQRSDKFKFFTDHTQHQLRIKRAANGMVFIIAKVRAHAVFGHHAQPCIHFHKLLKSLFTIADSEQLSAAQWSHQH